MNDFPLKKSKPKNYPLSFPFFLNPSTHILLTYTYLSITSCGRMVSMQNWCLPPYIYIYIFLSLSNSLPSILFTTTPPPVQPTLIHSWCSMCHLISLHFPTFITYRLRNYLLFSLFTERTRLEYFWTVAVEGVGTLTLLGGTGLYLYWWADDCPFIRRFRGHCFWRRGGGGYHLIIILNFFLCISCFSSLMAYFHPPTSTTATAGLIWSAYFFFIDFVVDFDLKKDICF